MIEIDSNFQQFHKVLLQLIKQNTSICLLFYLCCSQLYLAACSLYLQSLPDYAGPSLSFLLPYAPTTPINLPGFLVYPHVHL